MHRGEHCISEFITYSDTAITVVKRDFLFRHFLSGFIQNFLNTHCGELVSVCEAYLGSILLSENGTENLNEDLMVRIFPSDYTSFIW